MDNKVEVAVSKNLRGVSCPMNLVYTKVTLAALKSGEVAEIILDNGAPINNVPGSVLREGHEIICQSQLDDGAWSILVRKGG